MGTIAMLLGFELSRLQERCKEVPKSIFLTTRCIRCMEIVEYSENYISAPNLTGTVKV